MFDKATLAVYRDTALSRDMRAEILARHESRHAWLQRAMRPAAAMLSLVLIAAVVLHVYLQPHSTVTVGDTSLTAVARTLSTEEIAFRSGWVRTLALEGDAAPLATAHQCIPLALDYEEDVFLSVSGGILVLTDAEGELCYAGTSGPVTPGAPVYWALDQCETLSPLQAEIRSTAEELLATVTLTYVSERGVWQGALHTLTK